MMSVTSGKSPDKIGKRFTHVIEGHPVLLPHPSRLRLGILRRRTRIPFLKRDSDIERTSQLKRILTHSSSVQASEVVRKRRSGGRGKLTSSSIASSTALISSCIDLSISASAVLSFLSLFPPEPCRSLPFPFSLSLPEALDDFELCESRASFLRVWLNLRLGREGFGGGVWRSREGRRDVGSCGICERLREVEMKE